MAASLPDYDSLPYNTAAGKRSAVGLFRSDGMQDHLGALNNLTAASKLAAAREVVHGISFQLDWPFVKAGKPAFGRKGLEHRIIDYESITGERAHDDEIAMNTQCGSQWDGFNHYADQNTGMYYNNVKHSDPPAVQAEANGIHHWCEQGIVARGVLLDWPRWLEQKGEQPISPVSPHAISVEDLNDIAKSQGIEFAPGDLLIIRTGFIKWFESVDEETREKAFAAVTFAGIKAGDDTQRWLWNSRFCAVTADSVSMECYPPSADGATLHQWMLPYAGIPIGELWDLEALSETCAKLKKWSFLVTSAPLNVYGGIASPANAVAVL